MSSDAIIESTRPTPERTRPPQPAFATPSTDAEGKLVALKVNTLLCELHRSRVNELGVDASGLYDHYHRRLNKNEIVDPTVAPLARAIVRILPEFETYHVLRAGLGELAFVLAAMGLRTVACDVNTGRFKAIQAGFEGLCTDLPIIRSRLGIRHVAIPSVDPGNRTLGIAKAFIGFRPADEEKALISLAQYDALLVQPSAFLWQRTSADEQHEAIASLRRLGFTTVRELPEFGMVYCSKPGIPAKRNIVLRNELPSIDNIVAAVASHPTSEAGCHALPVAAAGVRDFPFPFAAGLALATGTIWESRRHFRLMREFLAGRGETPHGDGLGLEIGGAFTLSRGDTIQARFGTGPAQSEQDESHIVELARAGWIDTLRDVAVDDVMRRKLDALAEVGVVPTVGIDISGQCTSLRFTSDAGLLEREKFGDNLDYRRSDDFIKAVLGYGWESWADVFPARSETLLARFNSVLQQPASQSDALPFKRFIGHRSCTWTTFPGEVNSWRLDDLVRCRGAVVVDLEAATWSLVGAEPHNNSARALDSSQMFDLHAMACFKEIAERRNSGSLLVTTVTRLLDWLWRREHLTVETVRDSDKWIVTLDVAGKANGNVWASALLDGLALSVPATAPEVVVQIVGHSALPVFTRVADPATAQRDVLYRPWSALEWTRD